MTTPPTAITTLAAKRPIQAPKPRPSRTEYRPAATPPTFKETLQAATSEASLAQSYASPSAARIAAPPSDAGNTDPGSDASQASPMPALAATNPMLWESLVRGPSMPLTPNASAGPAVDGGTV